MASYASNKPSLSVPLGGEIVFELTERCNNNCAHCCINLPADCESARKKELSAGDVLAIVKQAASLGYMTVRFTGGEPLLREDFVEIYTSVRRMGMKVRIFTNATLITPELADLFARIPPIETIEITVYGMHKKSYEAASRTPGSFEAAWRGIQMLLDRSVPIYVKGAMLPGNLEEIAEFREWAMTIPGMDRSPAYAMNFTLRCRRDDEKKNDLIRKVRLSADTTLSVLDTKRQAYLKDMAQFAQKFMRPLGDLVFSCGPGVCVDPYGYMHPCTELRCPDTAYDLRTGSLQEAIDSFLPKLKSMRSKNPDYLAKCARCFLKSLCKQCPSKAWTEHGVLDKPVDYFCEIAHEQARHIGLIEGDERGWEISDWKDRVHRLAENIASEPLAVS